MKNPRDIITDPDWNLVALDRAGYIIVPKKPTNKMICAALDAWDSGKRGYSEQWAAMISATIDKS